MGLIQFDVFGVQAAATKATAAAERLSTLAGKVGSAPLPPMRPEDRGAVMSALSAAATAVRKPVPGIRNVAGEMSARSTLLLRDIQESASSFLQYPGFAVGIWAGSEESVEIAIAHMKRKYKVSGAALAAQLKKHQHIGRGRGRVTKSDKARLRELRKNDKFWERWLTRADRIASGPSGRVLGRLGRVLGHPITGGALDFMSVALNSPMLNNWGSKSVAGGSFAGSNLALGAVPGGAIFGLIDAIGMATVGKHGYSQVSISNMNTISAQTLGAFDQAFRTGDYSGLEQIHQASLEGKTTIVQTGGAYLGESPYYIHDLYTSGDVVGYHEASLAGQHGTAAENLAVTGETVNDMVTDPGTAISDAWHYWGSKL